MEKWGRIEENIWQQKARVDWIKLGDTNTKFFHASVKVRQNMNVIHKLVRDDESIVRGQKHVSREIREFYMRLMGTSAEVLPMLDQNTVKRGAQLNIHQQRMLDADCTEQEVRKALFSMNSSKAPGIDGFNVHFFKRSWHIIGKEIVEAVQQFFEDNYLPAEMNVALITLLPKCENADKVSNFRPIACCYVVYKIISKILANRMKGVLDSIIGKAQSAFVPGRLIFDNILLSHELIKGYQRKNISPRCMIKIDVQKAYDSVE